jgi:hypothetical protein
MSAWWSKLTRRRNAIRQVIHEADLVLLLRIGLFASIVPLLMRLKPSRLRRLLLAARRRPSASPETVETIVRHLQFARLIGSPLVRPGCLTRGVTLCYFLRRAGVEVTLAFGMRQVAGTFTGHCWLHQGGVPLLEQEDPRLLYAHIFSIPEETSRDERETRRTLRALVSS